jgi:uncharacterized protein YbjT (DUF2867 family)
VILVIGGSSKIGAEVVRLLRARGEPVRALVRSGESGAALRELGAEPVTGDLARPETVSAALAGADRLFLLSGPNPDAVAWHRDAIDAAARAGVRLLVRSSIVGADPASPMTFARQHGESDDHLRRSGVPFVIVRPNYFMQNVTEQNAPSIGADGMLYVPAGESRLSMTDTRDAAAVAAVALTEEGHAGQAYDATGPEALSHREVAAKLGATLGRQVTYASPPLDVFRQTLAGFGVGDWMVACLAEMYEDYQRSGPDGYASRVTDAVQRVTGRPPRSLDGLLAEWRAATSAGGSGGAA